MATIHKEILIDAPTEAVWDAARDYGALHTRLVPGFVAHCELAPRASPPVRIVRFAHGTVLRETIVSCDDDRRRLVWSARADAIAHHNGALQLFEAGPGRTRATWTADVLPDTLANAIAPLMEQGLEAMRRRLEGAAEPAEA